MDKRHGGFLGSSTGRALFGLLTAALLPRVAAAQDPPAEGTATITPAAPSPSAAVGVVALRRIAAAGSGAETAALPVVVVGSGAVVSADGVVATARTKVEGAVFLALRVAGRSELIPAVRVSRAEDDLALLVPASGAGAPFDLAAAADARPTAGQAVTVGTFPASASATAPTSTTGSILRGQVYGLVEVSASLAPEALGAPLVDGAGRLLGVLVLGHEQDASVAYALPASAVADALDTAATDGSLAAAQAAARAAGTAPYLPAAVIDTRWLRVPVAGESDAPPGMAVVCSAAASADLSAALAGRAPAADDPANGFAALLYGALSWNVAACDLRRVGLDPSFLARRETVGAWLA